MNKLYVKISPNNSLKGLVIPYELATEDLLASIKSVKAQYNGGLGYQYIEEKEQELDILILKESSILKEASDSKE